MARDDDGFHGVSGFLGWLSDLTRQGEDAIADKLGHKRREPSPYVIVRRQDVHRGGAEVALGGVVLAGGISCLIVSSFWAAPVSLVLGAACFGLGWGLASNGRSRVRMAELLQSMSRRLGDRQSVTLAELGQMAQLTPGDLRRRLDGAIAKGYLPEGRIAAPLGKEKLYLTDASFEADCALRDARASGMGAEWDGSWRGEDAETVVERVEEDAPPEEEPSGILGACAKHARRLRELAGQTGDAEVAELLRSIAGKVDGLAAYAGRHPEVESQLRKLANYYLPTTCELAESFVELEGRGSGTNASTTREGLKATLRDVDEGLTKLSDDLLQDQAFDLKADMEVMRSMLEQDGLSEDD